MTICKKHVVGIINIIKQFYILHACDKTSKLNPVFKMNPCNTFIFFKFKLIMIPFQLYSVFIVKISCKFQSIGASIPELAVHLF